MTPRDFRARRRKGYALKKLILKLEHDLGRGIFHSGHPDLDTSACDQAYEGPHIKVYAKAEGDEAFQPVALYVTAEDKGVQIPGTNVFVPYQEFEGSKTIEFMVA